MLGLGFVLLGGLLTAFSAKLADGLDDALIASPWFYRAIGIAFFAFAVGFVTTGFWRGVVLQSAGGLLFVFGANRMAAARSMGTRPPREPTGSGFALFLSAGLICVGLGTAFLAGAIKVVG